MENKTVTTKWKPIETAPAHKHFLVAHSDGEVNIGMIEYGQPVVVNNGDHTDGGYGHNYICKPNNKFSEYENITHWMELPDAP